MRRGSLVLFLVLACLPPAAARADMVRVTVSLANVRARPGTHYRIVSSVTKGTLLTVVDQDKGWWKVRLDDGREGWIYKKAARREKEDYRTHVEAMAREVLGEYLRWAALNDVYLEEDRTPRLDVMVTPAWERLPAAEQKAMMLRLARSFARLCEEDPLLRARGGRTPYVAFFDRFNSLLGKANASDAVLAP